MQKIRISLGSIETIGQMTRRYIPFILSLNLQMIAHVFQTYRDMASHPMLSCRFPENALRIARAKRPMLCHAFVPPKYSQRTHKFELKGRVLSIIHPMPAFLNHTGRQSSRCNQSSPSVSFPASHPLHFGELGQLKNGICW